MTCRVDPGLRQATASRACREASLAFTTAPSTDLGDVSVAARRSADDASIRADVEARDQLPLERLSVVYAFLVALTDFGRLIADVFADRTPRTPLRSGSYSLRPSGRTGCRAREFVLNPRRLA